MEADLPTRGVRWLPNALTVMRCGLAITVGVALMLVGTTSLPLMSVAGKSTALPSCVTALPLAVFVVAAITDFFDGYLARRWNAQSAFGELIDPIADKLLILIPLAWFSFVYLIHSPLWIGGLIAVPTLAILVRDSTVTALRLTPKGKSIASPSSLAKAKTFLEMLAVIGLLVVPIVPSANGQLIVFVTATVGLWLGASASAVTGLQYLGAYRATGQS